MQSIRLGRVFGVPVYLDLSWFLIFGLLTWSLASTVYPAQLPDSPVWFNILLGAVTAILLFVSVLLHEFGHALTALVFKIPVRRVRLMIFGGVAELGDESPNAVSEFCVAVAGPLVSMGIAVVTGVIWLALPYLVDGLDPLIAVLGYLAQINLMLAIFNLVPGFPLDGGRVLRSIIWGITGSLRQATTIAGSVGRLVAVGFVGLGIWRGLSGDVSGGLWMGLIGLFLNRAAVAEISAQRLRDALTGRTVDQVMNQNVASLPSSLTIQQVVNAHILGQGQRVFVITEEDTPVGILSANNIQKVSPYRWQEAALSEAMTPLDKAAILSPETEIWSALRSFDRFQASILPVMGAGKLMGVVRRGDVIAYLQALSSLDNRVFNPR
ncbi:MAG: site-2 protease family protein [Anaerolineae bacterium]|nr:site-2 protease family protein [Anaerolineae bacterium]